MIWIEKCPQAGGGGADSVLSLTFAEEKGDTPS